MRATHARLFLLVLVCLSSLMALAYLTGIAIAYRPLSTGIGENKPPRITGVIFVSWPELVGDLVVGYVNASDPEGEEVKVIGVFVLRSEWAEGVPEEQRIHNITGTPDPEHGPNCFKLVANTSGWLPGAYKVIIVAEDATGLRNTYEYDRELVLRIELVPPPETKRWAFLGLGMLACLLVVMLVGVVKALKTKPRAHETISVPPVVVPLPPELY